MHSHIYTVPGQMFDLPNNDSEKRDLRGIGVGVSWPTGGPHDRAFNYVFETLRQDEEFAFCRGRKNDGELPTILLVAPVSEHPVPAILERLEHEYSLRDELDSEWAARPLTLVRREGRPMLILEDPGGEPLDRLLGSARNASALADAGGQPMDLSRFLRFAIGLAAALGKLHQQGFVHKNIKPANILVDSASGAVWLTGFGIASRLPRERQSAEPPGMIAGTLAYMAPEQTGRMNRSIDSRSDLYSLGVSFYEMLTGTLPFKASDPMEWVHCHIARQPAPPDQYAREIPAPLSAIVMKLLAKTAEDRYQTAAGVEADLRRCLAEWEKLGRIDSFSLGTHDASDRLWIPERLYGRDREVKVLLDAFERVVVSGTSGLALVAGYSGIGKSSVVHELQKAIVPPRGLFIAGKFDQHKRDIPYSTLAQAFQTSVRQILGKSREEVGHWREDIRQAVGPNGQLITNLIPELGLIIGQQPPVPPLPPQEAQHRFQAVFRRFLGVFARKEHPLTLFLDDLQWLDAATLTLIEHLVTHPDAKHLLIIGAYRDNEVSPFHPLILMLDSIRKAGVIVDEIVLNPLSLKDVNQFIADALCCERVRSKALARLVHKKTAGNPFFVIQFLTALAGENLVEFDSSEPAWKWDVERIHAKGYTDNVVDLMAGKLSRLPHPTQEALGQLACLGNVAEIATLALVQGESEKQIHAALWEAVRVGLVFRRGSVYTFLHDRVQEAAYALIAEGERAAVHLRIGRLFVSGTASEETEEKIFEIVNQLNRGSGLIDSLEERERVAELNLFAGKRAKTSTAYASALRYLIAGRALLAEESWEQQYALTFALEFERAECEFLSGDFAAAEERLLILSRQAEDVVDGAVVARLQTELYAALDQNDRAVAAALQYLRRAGVDWSPHPTTEEVRREYERIWQQLGDSPIEALVDLPPMTDLACRATIDLLTAVEEPSFFIDQNLRGLVIARIVNLSLEHGNSDGSCVAYVQLGWLVGPRFDDHKTAFRFGKLGLDLMERRGLERFRTRVSQCFGYFINPWSRQLRSSLELLRRSFHTAQEAGDIKYAVYSWDRLVTILLAAGDPLSDVRREAETGLEFARKANFGYIVDIIIGELRFIRALQGLTTSLCSFSDPEFDESRFEQNSKANPHSVFARCWYWLRKLQVCFYAGDYAAALEAASKAEPLLQIGPGHFEGAEFLFYDALARVARYDSATPEEKTRHREVLAAHHRQIVLWAENCPENFGNRAALVAAEVARIEGRDLDAMHLYEEAIQSARENGFLQNEAAAHETAARFYAARGFAHAYFRKARYCYLRWGALGKVRQIDQQHPPLHEERTPSTAATIETPVEQLDLKTVMKASQAVSSEIVLEQLIDTLMVIAVEHAGAERGLLILPHGEELRIAAEARTGRDGVEVEVQDALVTPLDLPDSLLHYVIRTQESVILDDGSTQNLFWQDEYVRQQRPRSILCLPLVKQTKLMGILYLENNLAPGVFTSSRFALLELLASQAAISLDSATLYADLAELNADLTQENRDRRRAEEALRASEERLQDIIDNTSAVIFVKDLELRYILINREYERRHHVRRDQIRGKTDFDIHSYEVAEAIRANDRRVIEAGVPIQFEEVVPSEEGDRYCIAAKFLLRDHTGKPYAVCGIATDITESKRAEQMQAAIIREREMLAQQRAIQLAKANAALRECLDALASVPELDEFLGQVMAAITRQLSAASSVLRLRNFDKNVLTLDLVFQDGRVMTPAEAKYPESLQTLPLDERQLSMLNKSATVMHLLGNFAAIPHSHRSYLVGLGIKTLLVIPLVIARQLIGSLTFRFTEDRELRPEEIEIAQALASQASLAIQLTRLAKTARQSAVLEERNRLAGEIHDSLAQNFAGIAMQLAVAEEELTAGEGAPLDRIRLVHMMTELGLAEARRSALSLRSTVIEESGLVGALQMLIERSNVAGRLRCNFHSSRIPEERLPGRIQHELLRIAQEAISNAIRHGKPTLVTVTLRWEAPNLILQIKDNGSGIPKTCLEKSGGIGLRSLRERAAQIGAELVIRTGPSRGATVIVTVPISL
jgi:PAS domain S-box-containing protein